MLASAGTEDEDIHAGRRTKGVIAARDLAWRGLAAIELQRPGMKWAACRPMLIR
jgi:hypothetical protein